MCRRSPATSISTAWWTAWTRPSGSPTSGPARPGPRGTPTATAPSTVWIGTSWLPTSAGASSTSILLRRCRRRLPPLPVLRCRRGALQFKDRSHPFLSEAARLCSAAGAQRLLRQVRGRQRSVPRRGTHHRRRTRAGDNRYGSSGRRGGAAERFAGDGLDCRPANFAADRRGALCRRRSGPASQRQFAADHRRANHLRRTKPIGNCVDGAGKAGFGIEPAEQFERFNVRRPIAEHRGADGSRRRVHSDRARELQRRRRPARRRNDKPRRKPGVGPQFWKGRHCCGDLPEAADHRHMNCDGCQIIAEILYHWRSR